MWLLCPRGLPSRGRAHGPPESRVSRRRFSPSGWLRHRVSCNVVRLEYRRVCVGGWVREGEKEAGWVGEHDRGRVVLFFGFFISLSWHVPCFSFHDSSTCEYFELFLSMLCLFSLFYFVLFFSPHVPFLVLVVPSSCSLMFLLFSIVRLGRFCFLYVSLLVLPLLLMFPS